MRPLLPAFVVALAAFAAGCSKSPCQELGEKLCGCTGLSSDACKTQVEDQLKALDPSKSTEDLCDQFLGTCNAPPNAQFCEWLLTTDGKEACGLAKTPSTATP